jgi:hemerythrin-like domain-containing protein
MLRDPSLIPLSRQHHNGLALCVLSRRSLAADSSAANVRRVAKHVIDQFELELTNHFEIEERVLFPACGPLPIINELLADHRSYEAMIAQLRTEPSIELMEQMFVLLTQHIRREERELFEHAQRSLPREALDRMGVEIERQVVKICL